MPASQPATDETADIPFHDIERELSRQFAEGSDPSAPPTVRARMSNLLIYSDNPEATQQIQNEVPEIVFIHPARVLLLAAEPQDGRDRIRVSVSAWCRSQGGGQKICSEQVTLRAGGRAVDRLSYAVRELLIGDLPTGFWWAVPRPPTLQERLLMDLEETVQQVIYDSIGWPDPAGGFVKMTSWLSRFESQRVPWRVASDLNWRRLKSWRRFLAQMLDPATAPEALPTITEVVIVHGKGGAIQSMMLAGWLSSCLGWTVNGGNVKPGVEMNWQLVAPQGQVRLRLVRQADAPADIGRIQVACKFAGSARTLDISNQDPRRFCAEIEGQALSQRVIAVKVPKLAELVGRQLSDRERDAVFHSSMVAAQRLAQAVRG